MDAECVTLCVIDDCLDSDVPLLEVSLNDLHVEQVSDTLVFNKYLSIQHLMVLILKYLCLGFTKSRRIIRGPAAGVHALERGRRAGGPRRGDP